ncbi:MAG: hypothetical protein H7338_09225, partial [Candidatus Sericytochromatia bacterium]|nr:hypothetical protein [Candidatus Sericytochromatia bacterium]
GFYTTTEFVIMGSEGSRTIPPMNVAWTPNLNPTVDGSAKAPVTFSWAPAADATSYSIRIVNASNNTVFSSDTLQGSAISFTWDGMANGAKAAAGQYAWSVNVNTPSGFGGTNISKFTLQ